MAKNPHLTRLVKELGFELIKVSKLQPCTLAQRAKMSELAIKLFPPNVLDIYVLEASIRLSEILRCSYARAEKGISMMIDRDILIRVGNKVFLPN